MRKIKLFLASFAELKPEQDHFEQEIYRKCKDWFDRGIFLHLDIWEDLSARFSATGSQSEYNKFVESADLFVLLVPRPANSIRIGETNFVFINAREGRNTGYCNRRATQRKGKLGRHIHVLFAGRGTRLN